MTTLNGACALVTGASRGVGRGIAQGLYRAGATVYASGRSIETADLDDAIVRVTCDHSDDRSVDRLFERIVTEQGRLDVLVNNAWGGYENMVEDGRFTWSAPFWDQPLWRWAAMMDVGVRAAFVASQHAARLMVPCRRGLIVNFSQWAAQKYHGNVIYGVSKAATRPELRRAIGRAREFDRKIVVEEAVPDAREIECAVLGNDAPEVSVAGEILPAGEFYDYESKYVDDRSTYVIPADLPAGQARDVRALAGQAFRALDGAGLARVDFLVARGTGRLYLNEVNTIPGFTTISMYAKLWEASGLDYPRLLERLVELALARHAEKQRLRTSLD